jgi:hypothetical protein
VVRDLTDSLEPVSPLRPLRPAGAPGSRRGPRVIGPAPHEESETALEEKEGSETYDAEGHVHHSQVHKLDLED